MGRLPRVYVKGAAYYITCRGYAEDELFKEKRDYLMYIELLEKYRTEFNFKLFAYVLLPHHMHLLIEPNPEFEISDIMRSLNTAYSKYFNSTYGRRGHLFRERFKACIVEKQRYLLSITSYMHRNPIRMGLVESLDQYQYSSSYLYNRASNVAREEINEVTSHLEGLNYHEYINNPQENGELLHKRLSRGGIFGSKEFVRLVHQEIKKVKEESISQPKVKNNYRKRYIFGAITSLLILLAALFYVNNFVFKPEEKGVGENNKIIKGTASLSLKESLNGTEWKVVFAAIKGSKQFDDTLRFHNGQLISKKFSLEGFKPSNYSIMHDRGRIIWETVQYFHDSSISWRAEIVDDQMRGVINLRTQNEVQNFSFISREYRRRK